jgi:hypothetical protein
MTIRTKLILLLYLNAGNFGVNLGRLFWHWREPAYWCITFFIAACLLFQWQTIRHMERMDREVQLFQRESEQLLAAMKALLEDLENSRK